MKPFFLLWRNGSRQNSRLHPYSVYTNSAEETVAVGRQIARLTEQYKVVCLFGDLGAGKTTLIKGLVHQLTETLPEAVCSPTFSYLAIYEGNSPVYHFDLYRLQHIDDFLSMGFEEYLFSPGVCCLEWSERIASILPKEALQVTITHEGQDKRKICIESHD